VTSGDDAVAAAVERAKTTAARNIPVFDDLPLPADTANLRKGANLNDALLALLPLVGVWRGEGEGRGAGGDYRFGQQIVVSHDGGDYLNWEARSWRLNAEGDYEAPGLRETGYWRFSVDPADTSESLAIELLLAADIRVAASDSRFAQLEIRRGIYAFGGATIRLPRDAGWGNAMRWLLTGEEYDAAEAYRIGLVQEVVEPGRQLDRALELAESIATKSAPLGVKTTLASAHRARREGEAAAFGRLEPDMAELFETEDGREGLVSFIERREARFVGR